MDFLHIHPAKTSQVHNYQTIEHNWSTDKTFNNGFGYASYRLVLKGLDPNIQYGLLLERAGSSYQLYVNNNLTLSNGKIAKSETDSISENFTDKAVFKSDLNGNAEIIVEIQTIKHIIGGKKLCHAIQAQVGKNLVV